MIWSFSNYRLFTNCQRRWYFKTEIANANAKTNPVRREAYLLSKLQSIAAWRGNIVDQIISEQIVPALEKKLNLSSARILDCAKDVFDKQLEFAKRHRLRESGMSITKAANSFAAFYKVEYGLEIEDEEVARAWTDIKTALINLLQMHDFLNSIRAATKLVPQRALVFPINHVSVRAVPDLIAFYGDKPPLIVDWKVHTFGTQDYRLQLACYAIALTRCNPHKDFPPSLSRYQATDVSLIEVQLLTNQHREYSLISSDIEAIESLIATSSAHMKLVVGEDAEGEQPSPSDFPTTENPDLCQRCEFRSLCWEDSKWQVLKQTSFL